MKEKRKTHLQNLCENADDVIEMIEEAKSYDDIQRKYGVNRESIARFISESDYSARAREAQKRSADKISEKAELVLLSLEKGCDNAEIAKARELAHHYRWLAAKKNPNKFGDSTKIQAEVKDTSSTSSWLGEVLSEIDNNK
jgi:hypothetical protein